MKAVATGLLVAMALLFAGSTWAIHNLDPAFAWVQAFAEAALVGGLADWFAVTALFRHPLGLPIPHTAIIPNKKDRIGDALGTFLRENFFTPSVVARRLERLDAAGLAARFLTSEESGGRVKKAVVSIAGQLADTPAADALGERVKAGIAGRLRRLQIGPILGSVLDAALVEGRHLPVLDSLVQWGARTLDSQEGLIRAMVQERTAWLLRLLNVDERVANAIVDGLRGLLDDIAGDRNHPVRMKAEAGLANLAFDLKHLPETQARVQRAWEDILDNPAVAAWIDRLWGEAKDGLKGLIEGEATGEMAGRISEALTTDQRLADAVNALARRAVVGVVKDHGDSIVGLVSDTIRAWDAQTVTEKLEAAVTKDLQYIRLNGTLIGGTIGVVLHAILVLFDAH
jgi:uncharacterized membrane-anchored protein YjiN (DUF445 family)